MGAWIFAPQASGSNWVYDGQEASPSAAPVLSFANATPSTLATVLQASVVTNTAGGTLYVLASANAIEAVADVKAFGVQSSVSAAGLQNVDLTGLAPATPYWVHFVHTHEGNDSAVATISAQATTASLVSITTDVFRDWSNQAPLANLVVEHTLVMRLDRTVVLSLPNQSTNAQGRLVLTGPGLVGGVPHMVANWNADGSVRGLEIYTPS